MKHSQVYIKWFCRCFLIILVLLMTYVVTRDSYNFSHYVPHHLLRQLNIPYWAILWGEQHADKFLHFFGAAALVWLITYARFSSISERSALFISCLLCVGAECAQMWIGRGYNSSDLLLGILGSFMAYLGIRKNRRRSA